MNKLGLLAYTAQFGPRILQIRRRTWIGLGIGLVVMAGLFIWVAIALVGWFLGQVQGWFGSFKEAASGPAQANRWRQAWWRPSGPNWANMCPV